MGRITNEAKASEGKCNCQRIGRTDSAKDILCWSKGVIGTMTNEQEEKYCKEKNIKPATEGMRKRLILTTAMHQAKQRYKGEGMDRWIELVSEELKTLESKAKIESMGI